MTDRELEFAAKAAGYEVEFDYYGLGRHARWTGEAGMPPVLWMPREDDGDALRLAVMLRMNVSSWGSGASAIVSAGDDVLLAEPHYGDDPCRATRRAITRAAAEIGRNMP